MRTVNAGMWLAAMLVALAGSTVATQENAVPAGDWVGIFADEAWYKQQPGKEELFRGRLEAVQPPEASTLMRHAFYRLAGRAIYTGGAKVAALDTLVGAEIEIRGKAVEMSLEGQAIREIWPAAVRDARGKPGAGGPPK